MGHPIPLDSSAVPTMSEHLLKDGQIAQIRFAEPADFPTLGRVYAETYANAEGVNEHWEPEDAERMLSTINKFPNHIGLVATINDKIVGGSFGYCLPWQNGTKSFKQLETFVLPTLQKTGLGTHLREDRRKIAEVWYHPTDVELVTFSNIAHPKEWYRRLGFRTEKDLIIMTAPADTEKANLQKEVASVTSAGERAQG